MSRFVNGYLRFGLIYTDLSDLLIRVTDHHHWLSAAHDWILFYFPEPTGYHHSASVTVLAVKFCLCEHKFTYILMQMLLLKSVPFYMVHIEVCVRKITYGRIWFQLTLSLSVPLWEGDCWINKTVVNNFFKHVYKNYEHQENWTKCWVWPTHFQIRTITIILVKAIIVLRHHLYWEHFYCFHIAKDPQHLTCFGWVRKTTRKVIHIIQYRLNVNLTQ